MNIKTLTKTLTNSNIIPNIIICTILMYVIWTQIKLCYYYLKLSTKCYNILTDNIQTFS